MQLDVPQQVIRFQDFEISLDTGELRKSGHRVKLSGQPMQILIILLERPGQMVARDELQKRLWPDTFVDVDHSLNAAVNRIREALGDSAEKPQFIETVPRRGYRFIGRIHENADSLPRTVSGAAPGMWTVRSRLLLVATVVVVVVATANWITRVFVSRRARPEPRITRLTFDPGLQSGATWSPDGRFLAYSSAQRGKSDIWVQQVSGGAPVRITTAQGNNWQPDWSPDGKYIAYRSEDGSGGIFVIPAFGTDAIRRRISDFGVYPRWSPDGKRLLFLSVGFAAISGVFVKDADGSGEAVEVMQAVTKRAEAMSAVWHPDGRRITVWEWTLEPTILPNFWTGDSRGGKAMVPTQIPPDLAAMAKNLAGDNMGPWADADFRFAWAPAGDALYFERSFRGAKNIWRMGVDPQTFRATSLQRLTTGSENESDFALSPASSTIAFTSDYSKVQAWIFPFDALRGRLTGQGEPVTSGGMEAWQGALSPDSTRMVFSTKRAGQWELWEKSLITGIEAPLVPNDDYVRNEPQWSPDSARVVYVRQRASGEQQIAVWDRFRKTEEPLSQLTRKFLIVFDWSPDGQSLLVSEQNEKTGRTEIWREPINIKNTNLRKLLISRSDCDFWQEKFSPDGKWIVFESICDGPQGFRSAIELASAEGDDPVRVTAGGHWDDKPRWSPNGRSVYFISDRNGYLNVFGVPVRGQRIGQVFEVSHFNEPAKHIPDLVPMVGLSIGKGRLMTTVSQRSGSLWVLDEIHH